MNDIEETLRRAIMQAKAAGLAIGFHAYGVHEQDGVYKAMADQCVCAAGALLLGQPVCLGPRWDMAQLLGISKQDASAIMDGFDRVTVDGLWPHPTYDKYYKVGRRLAEEFRP